MRDRGGLRSLAACAARVQTGWPPLHLGRSWAPEPPPQTPSGAPRPCPSAVWRLGTQVRTPAFVYVRSGPTPRETALCVPSTENAGMTGGACCWDRPSTDPGELAAATRVGEHTQPGRDWGPPGTPVPAPRSSWLLPPGTSPVCEALQCLSLSPLVLAAVVTHRRWKKPVLAIFYDQ